MANKNGKSPKEVLIDARRLIEDEDRWITGTMHAVDDHGQDCFCSLGAIAIANGWTVDEITNRYDLKNGVSDSNFYDNSDPAIIALGEAFSGERYTDSEDRIHDIVDDVWTGNDRSTHEGVLRKFDEAIAHAE